MEFEDGQIYKSPFVFWPEKSYLLYGSGPSLFIFDLKECKLFKKIEYSEPNQFVRSIHIDGQNRSILVAFDNKHFHVYSFSFDLLFKKSFSKKISFIATSETNVVIGDFFGDISVICLDVSKLPNLANNCKIFVPFSHYSTITSSSISNDLLFTGNKDGKVVVHSLKDLHEIKDIYLSHKMPVCYLEVVGDHLLISLSLDNSLRFWSITTGLELYRIVLENTNCPPYHLTHSLSDRLLFLLLLDRLLVVKFDFEELKVVSHFTFKLPFTSQSALFCEGNLYLFDHYSNLHQISANSLLQDLSRGELQESNGSSNKVKTIEVGEARVPLSPKELFRNSGSEVGIRVNVGKHINLD